MLARQSEQAWQTLEQLAAQLVGLESVLTVQDTFKRAMLKEALARTQGNYTAAAALLGVKRQAIQQMVNRYELLGWVGQVRAQAF